MRLVVLSSGGMDSTTLLAHALSTMTTDVLALSVDYGQRHAKELDAAARVAAHYGVEHTVVDLTALRDVLAGSSLTSDDVAVPDGHYAEESMRITVVPNRNLIMLAVAGGLAVSRQAERVLTAVHAGDHFIYPDCRPEFIRAASAALYTGTFGFAPDGEGVEVAAPFLHKSKTWIAYYGHTLGVPFDKTWSCYKGGDLHCGTCGTCVERQEAFRDANVDDPTAYQLAAFE
jgi:7-cyano-7-deazaguanine synthase